MKLNCILHGYKPIRVKSWALIYVECKHCGKVFRLYKRRFKDESDFINYLSRIVQRS